MMKRKEEQHTIIKIYLKLVFMLLFIKIFCFFRHVMVMMVVVVVKKNSLRFFGSLVEFYN